VWAAVAVHS